MHLKRNVIDRGLDLGSEVGGWSFLEEGWISLFEF